MFRGYLNNSLTNLNLTPSRKRAAIWHTIGGGIANCIIIIQGFLLIPLFIDFLGPDLYGYWLATGGVLAWLAMVDVGGDTVARQRCAEAYGKGNFQRMLDYFWHGLVVTLFVVGVFAAILLFAAPFIPILIHAEVNSHSTLINCLLLAGVGTVLNLFQLFFRGFASAAQRNFLPMTASALGLLLALVLTIIGLVVFHWGLYALAIAAIIRSFVPCVANALFCGALLRSVPQRCSWSWDIFKDFLVTTPSVFAAKAANVFSSQLPLVLLTRWYGPESTVAFTVTMRLLGVIGNFINHPIAALNASSAHFFGDPQVSDLRRKAIFERVMKGFLSVGLSAFLGYILFNHGFIELWVSDTHYLGLVFTFLAALGNFLMLRNSLYSSIIVSSGAIRSGGYFSFLEKMLMALIQLALVLFYGALGVALSVVIATLVMQIPYHFVLKRRSEVIATSLRPLQWVIFPVGVVLLIGSLLSEILVFSNWITFLLCALLFLPLLILIFLSGLPDVRIQLNRIIFKSARRTGFSSKPI